VLAGLAVAAASACTQIEFLAANVPAVFGAYRRHADISYGTDPRQRLDLYVPEKAASARTPVVVFWHGGRWSEGDKSQYRFVGAALTELGCVAILPNYRHYPLVKMPGFMHDSALAAAWAANYAHESHDAKHFFLMGHSSGAHLATLVTLDPRYFSAIGAVPYITGVIALSGPYDFLPLLEADLQDMFGPAELYPQSQPINFVRADAPPMLLMHGLRDKRVSPNNTRSLSAALQALGGRVTSQYFPEADHGDLAAAFSVVERRRLPVLPDILAFIGQQSAVD
jgi:acetyl esterase/lipase